MLGILDKSGNNRHHKIKKSGKDMKNIEIAKKLNISPATVSLALNNREGVSEETRRKVVELKNDLLKNDLRNISRPEAGGEIGFIIYKETGRVVSETPFFVTLTEMVCHCANKNGYSVEIRYYTFRDDLQNFLAEINSSVWAGCLILATEIIRSKMETIAKMMQKPFVVLDAAYPGLGVDGIYLDNRGGIFKAIQYAVSMGHKEIGYITCDEKVNNFVERFESYKFYLEYFGLKFEQDYVFKVPYVSEMICMSMKEQVCRKKKMPSVLIAANDIIAFGSLNAFLEMNIKVPEEISIIGFDDMPSAKYVTPRLTTVSLNNEIIAKNGVYRLTEMIRKKDWQHDTVHMQTAVSVDLVIRNSVNKKSGEVYEQDSMHR